MRIRLKKSHFSLISPDGRQRQYRWTWVVPILLVPPLFALILLAFDPVAARYLKRTLRDPSYLAGALATFAHSNSACVRTLLGAIPVKRTSKLPTMTIVVPKNTLVEMQRALRFGDPELRHDPGGTMPYYRALLIDEDGALKSCKITLRGHSAWHHAPEKPSLRVKIRKSDIRKGRRYLELQRPEDALALKNWLPDQIGRRMGLLSDMGEHVRLFINKKFFGVYLLTMRAGEPLAIMSGRMPGTFFRGEILDYKGNLWDSTERWRVFGDESEENLAVLERFLETLRHEPSAAALEHFWDYLDMETYAKWAALMIVAGSTHTDDHHNQAYFYCPNQGKLEAVPWDCRGYGAIADPDVPPDVISHPVMEMAACDPRWVHRRNRWIHELLHTHAKTEQVHTLIDESVERMLPDLMADDHLMSVERTRIGSHFVRWSVTDLDERRAVLKDWVARRNDFLEDYLSDARVFVEPLEGRPGWSRLEVAGTVAVKAARTDGVPLEANTWPGTPSLLYPGLTQELESFTSTPYDEGITVPFARPSPVEYRVHAEPEELRFTNAVTGDPITPSRGRGGRSASLRTVHPSAFPVVSTEDVVLGPGEVVLTSDLITAPGQRLVIRAGTRLRLREGVGIYAHGPTLVKGRPEAWVELAPAGPAPWACFGVRGPRSAGSRFEYMRVVGGSVGAQEGLRFRGMFSVYDCPDVTIRNCSFGQNHVGDDAVNLAQSTILVENCSWEDARADGLDLDMCDGTVRGCRWRNCGNDGLDLMACRLSVVDCDFTGSGDKGVSIGEKSLLSLSDCRISDCDIGLEIKDDSRALVERCVLSGNRLAVHSYQKKWLYGRGGSTALVQCTLEGSRGSDFTIEKRCEVVLVDTPLGTVSQGAQRIVTQDSLQDEWKPLMAAAE